MQRMTQSDVDRQNARVAAGKDKLSLLHAEVLARPTHLAKPSVDREKVLHEQILAECARRGWLACHGRMDKATGRTLGEPDFTIYADGGRWFLVECKTKTGKLTTEQLGFMHQLKKLGHEDRYWVVRSLEDFINIVTPFKT